jgi:hypothetical protein
MHSRKSTNCRTWITTFPFHGQEVRNPPTTGRLWPHFHSTDNNQLSNRESFYIERVHVKMRVVSHSSLHLQSCLPNRFLLVSIPTPYLNLNFFLFINVVSNSSTTSGTHSQWNQELLELLHQEESQVTSHCPNPISLLNPMVFAMSILHMKERWIA